MKLKNKKTGEIVDYDYIYFRKMTNTGHEDFEFDTNTLEGLNEEWEDVGTFWFLNGCGDVCKDEDDKHKEEVVEKAKQIGNYFKTKEEVEKAVEKLKAWKRLKDNGFKFLGWYHNTLLVDEENIDIKAILPENFDTSRDDLILLFGGEDD